MDELKLIDDETKEVLYVFYDYMDARKKLFDMGFSDSVHYTSDNFQRWQKNGKIFGLSHSRDGELLGNYKH